MAVSYTSPVTGGPQTGFTSPTYTLSVDKAPDVNASQWAVTALGGTQAGVRVHSMSDPFTISIWKPKVPKALPSPNPVTGRYGNIGSNDYTQVVRKGMNYAANQAPLIGVARFGFSIPAGCDAYDSPNVRALPGLACGAAWQQSAGIGDMLVNGVL